MSDNENSPYPGDGGSSGVGGLINLSYVKSIKGLLNFAIVGILLLGFICAVSLPLKDARTIDSTCNVTKPRVNIQSSSVSYMFFCVVTLVTFLLLALLNTVELPALSTVRDFLSSIITVALVGGLSVLLFIVSATQAASEHKLSVCNRMASDAGMSRLARPGGPGASCFFGLAGIGAMFVYAAMSFMK